MSDPARGTAGPMQFICIGRAQYLSGALLRTMFSMISRRCAIAHDLTIAGWQAARRAALLKVAAHLPERMRRRSPPRCRSWRR